MKKFSGDAVTRLEKRLLSEAPSTLVEIRQTQEDEKLSSDLRAMLRQIRELHGYSLEQLGDLIGISASAVSKMETGVGDIGIKTVSRAARALGCQVRLALVPAQSPTPQRDIGWPAFVSKGTSEGHSVGFGTIDKEKLESFHAVKSAHLNVIGEEIEMFSREVQVTLHEFHDKIAQVAASTSISGVAFGDDIEIEFTDHLLEDSSDA